jgi:hypothetical protein
MAWIVTGSRGRIWHGADWVVRNAFGFLIPALERSGVSLLRERTASALAANAQRLDLSDLLDSDVHSHDWLSALDASLAAIAKEGCAEWNEPQRFSVFVGAVRRLATLARADGNQLVVNLADACRLDSLTARMPARTRT